MSGLRLVVANALGQIDMLLREQSTPQLEVAIKSLLLVHDGIDVALPLLRRRLREEKAHAAELQRGKDVSK